MRTLQLILGSTAFLLCLWMTTGLLGDALLGPSEHECATLSRMDRPDPADITRAACLLQRKAAGLETRHPPATPRPREG